MLQIYSRHWAEIAATALIAFAAVWAIRGLIREARSTLDLAWSWGLVAGISALGLAGVWL